MTTKRGESAITAYNELVSEIPTGGFYLEELCRIPFRDRTVDFLFKAAKANVVYGIYVNDIFFGEAKSNWEGWLTYQLVLPRGECRIRILDSTDATGVITAELVHAKYLTWVGAMADALGDIDAEILRVYDSRSIEKVLSYDIQSNFGDFLKTPRVTTFTLDVYRELLQEIMQSFKFWSATPEGLENAIAAFTQIRPTRKNMRYEVARWVLGYQHLLNREMTERYRYAVTTMPATNIIPQSCSDSNGIGSASLKFTFATSTLQYKSVGDASYGAAVVITASGVYTLTSNNGIDSIVVKTQGALPVANTTMPITITGPTNPNSVVVEHATTSIVGGALMQISGRRLYVTGDGSGDPAVILTAAQTILDHLGEVFDASFWIQQNSGGNLSFIVEVSVDGGAWQSSSAQVVTPSTTTYTRVQLQLPIGMFGNSNVRVRLRCSAGTTRNFYVEKAALHSPSTGALYLGHNTIPRSRRRKFHGQELRIYNIEPLERQSYDILGFQQQGGWGPTPSTVDPYGYPSFGYLQALLDGLTQYVVPTYTDLYFFNNTVENMSGVVNVKGVMYETGWRQGTRINFNVVPRSPDRFSYLSPVSPTNKSEIVTFDLSGLANLSEDSISDPSRSVLLRDGVPMPNTTWNYVTSSSIQLTSLSELDPEAVYTFRYTIGMSYLSAVIDCGAKYYLFNWHADWYEYIRCGLDAILSDKTEGLSFSSNTLQATLQNRADTTSTTNELYMNDTKKVTKLSTTQWRFIDPLTVKIEPEVFSASNMYTLVYTSRGLVKNQIPDVKVELRYSTNNVTWSSWVEIPHDAPFGNSFRYFQFRVSVDNVTDIRDYKLRSLTMKGDPLDRSTIESLV